MVDIPMIDFETIRANTDCRQVIERDLGAPTSRTGLWVSWPCPFHAEHTQGGFQVKANGYHCFSCGAHGDAIDWLIRHHGMSYAQAVETLGGKQARVDPREAAERAAANAERQAQALATQIAEAEKVLKELREAQAWLRYHNQLTEQARQTWETWGVPEFWQDYWRLGFDPDRAIWTGSAEWHTPTMTIPVFEAVTWDVLNIRHRLMNPPRPGDKYRPERGGLPSAAWVADPDRPVAGRTLIVEGEKKAMVVYITADQPDLQVIGVPGKNVPANIVEMLKKCEPVYICLDPDATPEAEALARTLGRASRVIDLPGKVDDLIIDNGLDKAWMRAVLNGARKSA
jgi:hypothetical protein